MQSLSAYLQRLRDIRKYIPELEHEATNGRGSNGGCQKRQLCHCGNNAKLMTFHTVDLPAWARYFYSGERSALSHYGMAEHPIINSFGGGSASGGIRNSH